MIHVGFIPWHWIKRTLIAGLVFVASSFFALPLANSGGSPTISRIEVQGNHRISEKVIRACISSQPAQPLDPAKVDRDIKAIYHLGAFRRVLASALDDGDEKILLITVDEKP